MNHRISKLMVVVVVLVISSGATLFAANSTGPYIGELRAQEIALAHAGVSFSDATAFRVRLERDDHQMVYEVKFSNGDTRYEYKLDAMNGGLDEYEFEVRDISRRSSKSNPGTPLIGMDKALDVVLGQVPGVVRESIRIKGDRDDGRTTYEGEFYHDGYEYEFKVDAVTGRILSWEGDSVGTLWR